MPIVGHFTGGVDFSDLMYVLSEELVDAGGTVVTLVNAVMYGEWINPIINLILVGFLFYNSFYRIGFVRVLRLVISKTFSGLYNKQTTWAVKQKFFVVFHSLFWLV